MDGPQACSRWAWQPQPQLCYFKKPFLGLLPSPNSNSGRSEAPENSETSPREKGNQGLPVLQTDGSTHLEQIVGSNQATLSQCATIWLESGARLEGTQDTSDRRWGKGDWCRWIVEQNTGPLRVTLLRCHYPAQHLQHLEERRRVNSHVPIFRADGRGTNADVPAWDCNRNIYLKKRSSATVHLCGSIGKRFM